jgi:hypothetical protein
MDVLHFKRGGKAVIPDPSMLGMNKVRESVLCEVQCIRKGE